MSSAGTGLRFEDVTAGYGGSDVLSQLSFSIDPGDVVALVGPNGSGKSTIIRLASGVLRPRLGRIVLGKLDVAHLSTRKIARALAVVPQETVFPPSMRVRDFVALGRMPHQGLLAGFSANDETAMSEALARTDATVFADRWLEDLSGGERQRVVLARALAQSPRVLLLDEPTANLDLRHQVTTLELIRGLARQSGLTVLMAVHDLQLAALFADRILLVKSGRRVADGTPEQALTPTLVEATFEQAVCLVPHPTHGVPLVALTPNGESRRVLLSNGDVSSSLTNLKPV